MTKYQTIGRKEIIQLLAQGYSLRPAGLYEPEHAPCGTKFVHAQYSQTITRFVRLIPPAKKG